ncbi:MAG: hypothetical protein ACXVZV_11415 [Terriglobales bacterium]
MRRFPFILLIACLTSGALCSDAHRVPTNRADLKGGDWFPYVISKLAPLQTWTFEASPSAIKRENYSSDSSFQMSLHNTWDFPRFCFKLFRPKPEVLAALLNSASSSQDGVFWQYHDNCISAYASQPGYIGFAQGTGSGAQETSMEETLKRFEELDRNPPKADPEFVKKAMATIPQFCQQLEKRLDVTNKDPQQFDLQWLSKEGLRKHPPEPEDFFEPGSWQVVLAREPARIAQQVSNTSPSNQYLSFGITGSESTSILEELGVNWERYSESGDMGAATSEYPQLTRFVDTMADIVFSPDEAEALLGECLRAREKVVRPESIRGLDKLFRIASRAENQKLGIYFAAGED